MKSAVALAKADKEIPSPQEDSGKKVFFVYHSLKVMRIN